MGRSKEDLETPQWLTICDSKWLPLRTLGTGAWQMELYSRLQLTT